MRLLQVVYLVLFHIICPPSSCFMMKRASITQFFTVTKKQATVGISTIPNKTEDHGVLSTTSTTTTADSISVVPKTYWAPLDHVTSSWRDFVLAESEKEYFQRLAAFVSAEQQRQTVYPPADEIFTALNLCPLESVRVVIIGQDPYHGAGQAHGLAFSVKSGVDIPPSLRNMLTELKKDVGIRTPIHGNLEKWSRQGVMLLNTCLTVRKGEANSHQKQGWENFTDAAIKKLGTGERRLVFLLWGKPAQTKSALINTKRHIVITCSHPSPLSAYKTSEPFLGSKCFSRCNAALAEIWGDTYTPIDWNI
jgi:uracil-DNA glycosylase